MLISFGAVIIQRLSFQILYKFLVYTGLGDVTCGGEWETDVCYMLRNW